VLDKDWFTWSNYSQANILEKKKETDVDIRNLSLWNECRHSLWKKNKKKITKQMSISTIQICEADVDIRNSNLRSRCWLADVDIRNGKKKWNGCRHLPIQICKADVNIRNSNLGCRRWVDYFTVSSFNFTGGQRQNLKEFWKY